MQKFRILLLTLLMALLIIPLAFASVGVKNDGTMLGAATDINFSTGLTASGEGSEKTVVGGPVAAFTSGTVAGVTITGSTANSSIIGGSVPAAGTFTTLTGTTVNATDIIATTSVSSPTITMNTGNIATADINGGTIDGTVIGGATPAAGTFTDINADSVTLSTPNIGTILLPLNSFLDTLGAPITTTSTPGLEIDNLIPDIVWADGEVTPVTVTLKVPDDFLGGGRFRLFCDSSDSTTPAQVDFDVYVNAHNTTWDAAATDQTPVALSTAASTPCIVTLTPATDFILLAAGDVVTLRIWRDNVSLGTGDLEVYYAEFYYSRK